MVHVVQGQKESDPMDFGVLRKDSVSQGSLGVSGHRTNDTHQDDEAPNQIKQRHGRIAIEIVPLVCQNGCRSMGNGGRSMDGTSEMMARKSTFAGQRAWILLHLESCTSCGIGPFPFYWLAPLFCTSVDGLERKVRVTVTRLQ